MTEYFLGKREQIAMCEEDSWASLGAKTMVSNGFIVGKNAQITPDFSKGWGEILTAGADSRDIDSMEKGAESYKFTMTFNPTNWKFLRYCAHGTVTNTDNTTYHTHTFTATDTSKSFTLEWAKRGSTDHVITLTGCVILDWTVNFAKGAAGDGFITVSANCLAKSAVAGASTTTITQIPSTEKAFHFRMAKLTYAGSEVVEVNNGELTCNNGVEESDCRYCNSTLDQAIGEPIPKVRRYNCRFNINQKNDTYYDDWEDQVVVPSTNTLTFTRGTNDLITFTFTGEYLQSAASPTNIEGISNVDVVGIIKSVGIVCEDDYTDY